MAKEEQEQPSTEGYIKRDDFIKAVIEFNYDAEEVSDYFRSLGYNTDKYKVKYRMDRLIDSGKLALKSGNTPEAGLILKKTSTMYGPDGEVKLQWVTSEQDKEQALLAFEQALASLTNTVAPAAPIKAPTESLDDTMSVYTIGDAHVGMLAWGPESGEDNDLETVQQRHIQAMELLVEQSHPSNEAFIVDVGDFFHSDNADNRTANGGNALDVDGRYAKVLEVGLRLTTRLIELALKKHNIVRWRSAIGNHNNHSALMLNQFVKAYYRNEPRVLVHDTPSMFMYHQFGKNLIGITHGHTAKAEKLGEIMAVDCEELWSSSKHRYWYTGHVHHQAVKEFPSCVVETFRTLASKDAWHASMGYRSGQDMKCITLHKDYGEISRNTVSRAMLY